MVFNPVSFGLPSIRELAFLLLERSLQCVEFRAVEVKNRHLHLRVGNGKVSPVSTSTRAVRKLREVSLC